MPSTDSAVNGSPVNNSQRLNDGHDSVPVSSANNRDNRPKKQRRKKKKGSEAAAAAASSTPSADDRKKQPSASPTSLPADVEIEYVPDTSIILSHLASANPASVSHSSAGADAHDSDDQSEPVAPSLADYFGSVFAKFEAAPAQDADGDVDMADVDDDANGDQADKHGSESDSSSDDEDGEGQKMSNRKLRRAARLTVAELKQLVDKPEVVEWVDVTAPDPKLLVDIKSARNTIPVPQHWAQKRKYLQNKRGLEKSAFQLPDFILATGILEMRESLDKDGTKLKQKTRERVQPKMGKLVIDYAKLHAAFFKWQTKPELTAFGDVYFEGKEFEAKLKHVRPGAPLSAALREALGMPESGGAPPPFLFNMQRYGPPPSYPGLKIPGLNAPLPPGCMWGFHPGGWGKPPVDEYGRPLYGDVYGHAYDPMVAYREAASAWRGGLWGEMEKRVDDSDSDEDMDQESDDDDEIASEEDEPMELDTGAAPLGHMPPKEEPITSFGANAEDEEMELELQEYVAGLMAPSSASDTGADASATNAAYAAGYTTETPLPPRELYTVVGESASRSAAARGTLMGSDVVYDIRRRQAPGTETETPMTGVGGSADEQAKRRQRELQRERERERQQQASGTQSSRGGAGQGGSGSGRQRREFKF